MLLLLGTTPRPVLGKLPRHSESKAPHALTVEHEKDESVGGGGKELAGPSQNAIKLMRFPEFLWIEPDAKYIASNKLTSNYWCGAPLPDVQQMGAGATEGVSTHALCYSAVKTAVRLYVF